jgi:hypothetical protein
LTATPTPQPDDNPADPARTIARLAGSVAALGERVADLNRRLETATRRLDQAEVDQLAVRLADLDSRFADFAETITEALDENAPRGPAAPRWDNLPAEARAVQLDALRHWVDEFFIPNYVNSGGYRLAVCWDRHPHVIWELSTIAVAWRRAYVRRRPDLNFALDWHSRWLPDAMHHIDQALERCTVQHMDPPRR